MTDKPINIEPTGKPSLKDYEHDHIAEYFTNVFPQLNNSTDNISDEMRNEFRSNLNDVIESIKLNKDPYKNLDLVNELLTNPNLFKNINWQSEKYLLNLRVGDILNEIKKLTISSNDVNEIETCLSVVLNFSELESPSFESQKRDVVDSTFQIFTEKILNRSGLYAKSMNISIKLMEYYSDKDVIKYKLIQNHLEDGFSLQNTISRQYISSLCMSENSVCRYLGQHYLENIFQHFGLINVESFWHSSGNETVAFEWNISSSLQILDSLSRTDVNAPARLQQEYGITNFGRYPLNVLRSMYNNISFPDQGYNQSDYVVAYYPSSDHNGTFYQEAEPLARLNDDLSSLGYRLIVAEVDNVDNLFKMAKKIKRRYGKASGAIIAGHGDGNSVQLGNNSYLRITNVIDNKNNRIRGILSRFFKDDPTIVFASCSSGIDEGIGQVVSRKYGLRVLACSSPSYSVDYSAHIDSENKLILGASYSRGKLQKFLQGEKEN